jgi:hypothetical protein
VVVPVRQVTYGFLSLTIPFIPSMIWLELILLLQYSILNYIMSMFRSIRFLYTIFIMVMIYFQIILKLKFLFIPTVLVWDRVIWTGEVEPGALGGWGAQEERARVGTLPLPCSWLMHCTVDSGHLVSFRCFGQYHVVVDSCVLNLPQCGKATALLEQ